MALAWQVAFFVIGSDPVRFRPVMIPAILEKLGFVITALVFYARGRISNADASAAWPDLILGCLFIVAFFKARR